MHIDYIHLDTVDSTNSYAKRNAADFNPHHLTCIDADEQTAGRGRFKRRWISPKGMNLCITYYFHLPSSTLHLTSLAQVMAVSFAGLLMHEGLKPQIKWPNDILLGGKKLSGILCEISLQPQAAEVILGIGINVNTETEDLATVGQPATSLKVETGKVWDRKDLLQKISIQFLDDLKTFSKNSFTPFHDRLQNLLAYKGQQVTIFDGEKEWKGSIHSIASDGRLNLYLSNGDLITVSSGDLKL